MSKGGKFSNWWNRKNSNSDKDDYFYKFDEDDYDNLERFDRGLNFRQREGSASKYIFSNSNYLYNIYSNNPNEKDKYRKILESVASTACVISNTKLKIKWSDNTEESVNKFSNDTIFLSPDIVDDKFTKKKDWSQEERIDVLIGNVMLSAKSKDLVDPDCNEFIEDLKPGFKKALVVEFSNMLDYYSTVISILNKYPGFNNYLVSNRDYYASKNASKALEQTIMEDKEVLELEIYPIDFIPPLLEICRAIQYELVNNTELNINIAKVRDVMDDVKSILKRNIDQAEKRAAAAYKAAKILLKNFPIPKELENRTPQGEDLPNIGISNNGKNKIENNVNKELAKIEMTDCDKDTEDIFNTAPNNMNTCPSGQHNILPISSASDKDEYRKLLRKNIRYVEKLRNAIKSRIVDPVISVSDLQSGELDDDALYKISMNKKLPVGLKDLGLFEQIAIISKPKKSITLLLDESGSMNANNRWSIVRDLAIIVYNTLLNIPGIQVNILGHTADGHITIKNKTNFSTGSGLILTHYNTPLNRDTYAMARINANSGNLDGYALAKTAQFINEWKNNDYEFESHLWLISDGKPCSVGYGGMEAADHMKRVVRASLAKNIRIFGIGIDNAFDKKEGDSMYGAGNYIVLPDVISSMTVLGKKLTTVLNSGIKIVID